MKLLISAAIPSLIHTDLARRIRLFFSQTIDSE